MPALQPWGPGWVYAPRLCSHSIKTPRCGCCCSLRVHPQSKGPSAKLQHLVAPCVLYRLALQGFNHVAGTCIVRGKQSRCGRRMLPALKKAVSVLTSVTILTHFKTLRLGILTTKLAWIHSAHAFDQDHLATQLAECSLLSLCRRRTAAWRS